MLLDNWLSQRAQTCPDRCALIADGATLTYAELEREATAAARRLAARGARRGATVALTLPAGIEYVVLLHALMKLGAVAYPVNTRLSEPELDGELARAQPALKVNGSLDLGLTEADLPLLGEHDLDGASLPDPHQRHLGRAAPGRAHLRQPPLERGRLGLQPRGRADRPLALLPAAVSRRRPLDRHAQRHLRDHRRRPRRLRRRPRRLVAGGRRGDRDLARRDPARPPARGGGRPAAAARGAGRGRPGAGGRARGGDRPRRDRRPDLRAHRDGLAGDHAGARGGGAPAGLGGAAAADHPPADPGRRDPRPGADGGARGRRRGRLAAHRRPRHGSTRTASSTSPAGSAT